MVVEPFAEAERAAVALQRTTGGAPYDIAVVLGSGWAPAVSAIGIARARVAMAELPGFAPLTVQGHDGTVSSIEVSGRRVAVFAGRSHLYEGQPAAAVVHGVRTAVLAGSRVVVLTNAAGSLVPNWPVGGPVLISDHLNLTGCSPLVGELDLEGRPARFVDLSGAYSPRLREVIRSIDPSIPQGVYAALLGGAFETPAEIRMLRALGADLVGMSTALETIAAVHLGAEVLGLSLVTNLAAGLSAVPLEHTAVLDAGRAASGELGRLLRGFIEHC